MKQTAFMVLAVVFGTLGIWKIGPFAPVSVYYLFAVLRPQYLWEWALPSGVPWSQYVAIAAILGTLVCRPRGLVTTPAGEERLLGLAASHKRYLLFGAWVCITYVTAQNREVAWPWLLEYLKIFTMFAVAAFAVTTTRQIWRLHLLVAAALLYIAYEVNFLYLLEGRIDIYHRGFGGLDNNGAGLMLAMGVPLAISVWEGTQRWWRWIFAAGVPVLVHAVLMTYSRGAMLSLLLSAPLLLLRTRHRKQFGVLFLLLALSMPILAGSEIRARFFSLQEYSEDESAGSRFDSWNAAIRIANDFPVFGVGIRNANLLSHQYGADMEGRTIHSQYLQILADTGYPGLALYLIALVSLLRGMARSRRALLLATDRAEMGQMVSTLNGLEGAILVFCVGGTFLSIEVFELPYLVALLGGQTAALGMLLASTGYPKTTPSDQRKEGLQTLSNPSPGARSLSSTVRSPNR